MVMCVDRLAYARFTLLVHIDNRMHECNYSQMHYISYASAYISYSLDLRLIIRLKTGTNMPPPK